MADMTTEHHPLNDAGDSITMIVNHARAGHKESTVVFTSLRELLDFVQENSGSVIIDAPDESDDNWRMTIHDGYLY